MHQLFFGLWKRSRAFCEAAFQSSGGKERLGLITKMGDKDLRKRLIVGMTLVVGQSTIPRRSIHARPICSRENPGGSGM
jgi:hypothetical protein